MAKNPPKVDLLKKKIYKQYCLRYRYNFLRFVVEASGKYPTWQQVDLMLAMSEPNFRVSAVSGHGCHAKGHRIKLFNGSIKPVEDIKVGDQLLGDDGTPRNVLILVRGKEQLYRVIPESGNSFAVNGSHILALNYSKNEFKNQITSETIPVEQLIDYPAWIRNRYSLIVGTDPKTVVRIKDIIPYGVDDYFGFEIDGNHLYRDVDDVVHHNTGKSFTFAWFIIWHVTVYPDSNLILTGPKFEQLRQIIWKELTDALDIFHNRFPWIKGYFIKDSKCFYYYRKKEAWFAKPQTAPRKEPEKLAGQHRDKYTVLVEEASGLPDEHFDTIKGAFTGKDNSLALISQGTRPNGEFYDSHHSKKNLYKTFRFDSELSPIVTKRWIKERLIEYGGFFDPRYQIRVKGGFPNQLEGRLMARSWAEACGEVIIRHPDTPGILITVDVSGPGHDRTVYLVSRVSGWGSERRLETVELIIKHGESKVPAVAREVRQLYRQYEQFNPQLGVDHVGVGLGVYNLLQEWGIPVIGVNVNEAPYDEKQYRNCRAEWSWWLREAVFNCRISFKGVSKPTQQVIFDEFGNIPYKITDLGLFKLWSKEQMRNEGISSPDIYDVYMFAMGLDYVAMSITDSESVHFTKARAKAKEAQAAIEEQLAKAGVA